MTTVKRIFQEKSQEWSVGELVNMERSTTQLKESGTNMYSNMVSSQYVCIRETTDGQDGILVRGLGNIRQRHIMIVSGEPFIKDERDDLFVGKQYYSHPLPTADELKEVLDIVRTDENIQQKLKACGMQFDSNGTFWVSDTKAKFCGLKRDLQYYDTKTGRLATAKSPDEYHQRITVAFFRIQP